jgi:hypothetical protein
VDWHFGRVPGEGLTVNAERRTIPDGRAADDKGFSRMQDERTEANE